MCVGTEYTKQVWEYGSMGVWECGNLLKTNKSYSHTPILSHFPKVLQFFLEVQIWVFQMQFSCFPQIVHLEIVDELPSQGAEAGV